MAKRLEKQRDQSLEHVYIASALIYQGKDEPTLEKLEWMLGRVEDAIEAQRKIAKRDARAGTTPCLHQLRGGEAKCNGGGYDGCACGEYTQDDFAALMQGGWKR